ncbi:MAG: hypothetical protein C4547_11690 [Phycisphaerales bacterium]|nr:MAG: hypothetical protein C4547_11690 [Phycisphaerales bacterium]
MLCERVIVDELTKSASAISIFNTFVVPEGAEETEEFFVHLHLVGGVGTHTLGLEIVDFMTVRNHATEDPRRPWRG